MAGRIQAAYMLAPLVMDLADKKIPVKIVSLGHRSGAVIMVRTDSPYQQLQASSPASASPSPAASPSTSCSCARCWRSEGMTPEGHRDRRDAAARHAGGAVCEGGRRLLHRRALRRGRAARRLCAAAAHDARRVAQLHLLRADGARGADRARTGRWCRTSSTTCWAPAIWLDQKQDNRNKAVAIAAGRKFFNQDPNILRFVMENPTDRVTYGDLRMIRAEFEELMQLSIEAGTHQAPGRLREVHGRELRAGRAAARHRALR